MTQASALVWCICGTRPKVINMDGGRRPERTGFRERLLDGRVSPTGLHTQETANGHWRAGEWIGGLVLEPVVGSPRSTRDWKPLHRVT